MKNIKKYIPLIIVLVIAGLGFVYRENISRAVRGDAYVDNKIFTKQLEKAQKSGKEAFPQLTDKVSKNEAEVILHTSKGDITIKLFPTLAPKASENFLKHAKDKYYDGLTFHRVIKDFMIQSGDPKGDGTGGESIWKKGFAVEPTPFLYNIRGALAMANTGAKDSNGSQFFIVQNKDDQSKQLGNAGYPKPIIDAYKKGGYPAGDTKYTVFGQVIKGMDVVDTIANLEVDNNSKPKENVIVNSVEVVKDYKFK
jgi:peptidyl-prolyl cis-trans isomerase A (cyclophilin A)